MSQPQGFRHSGDKLYAGSSFSFSLQRTIALEEGQRFRNNLPPGMGQFPLVPVAGIDNKAPGEWDRDQGLLTCLRDDEALWISFIGSDSKPHAVLVGVSGVNAVNAEPFNPELKPGSGSYLVVPPQQWLDGIKTGDRTVRQFRSQPLGAGLTAGEQLNDELINGIEIVAYPPGPDFTPPLPRPSFGGGSNLDEILGSLGVTQYRSMRGATKGGGATRGGGAMFGGGGFSDAYGSGIGVGAKIEQAVYPDQDPKRWDPAVAPHRARLYIVNAPQWTQLTGKEPPLPPISQDRYPGAFYQVVGDRALGDVETKNPDVLKLQSRHDIEGAPPPTRTAVPPPVRPIINPYGLPQQPGGGPGKPGSSPLG